MSDATAQPKYKKRVIQESSSDESDDDVPLTKRAKENGTTANGSTSSAPAAPAPEVEMKDGSSTQANASTATLNDLVAAATNASSAEAAAAAVPASKKMSVFTTGGSDSEDDDDDAPLATKKSKSSSKKPSSKGKNGSSKKQKKDNDDASDDDDKPLAAKVKEQVKKEEKIEQEVKKLVKQVEREEEIATPLVKNEVDSDDDEEDDKPLATKSKKKDSAPKASSSKRKGDSDDASEDEEESDDDVPLSKKKKSSATNGKAKAEKPKKATPAKKTSNGDKKPKKEESVTPAKPKKGKGKGKSKTEDDDEVKTEGGDAKTEADDEDDYRWWDQDEDDGVTKWKTLEHNGVMFPPEYEPHGVKMKYNGKSVDLPPEAEEVASFFAAILETDYPKNPVFVRNFFDSFLGVLKLHPPRDGTKIEEFAKCDFTPIFGYLESEKAKKKEMTTLQKKAAKVERDKAEEAYKTCLLDGRKEKVGNFRVEPPGLFRGRGEHPKTGLLKTRVRPEQITINIGKDAKVPEPPAGHKWKDVVHDDTVTWLATWKENINGNVKYVFLAAGSSLKGQSDLKKFEKARGLKEHISRIRRDYTADLKNKEMATRQRATAIYLIDRFALRNGNEKGEDEADTVGCCSLRFEHVTLTPPTRVTFDFLGKDSIRYVNEVEVDEQVFKNLKIFKKDPKTIGDLLFDRLSTNIVNKYLNSYMDGLTAKVFRTYNASWTFQEQLKDTPADGTVAEKVLAYNRANRLVAVLCNHQRSVSKTHSSTMEKLHDKTRALKYQRKKLRCALLATGDKKKLKQFKEDESDLEDDWIVSHEAQLVVLEREKIRKKFEKENMKRAEDNEKPLPASELKERLAAADELEKTLKAERKKGWKESKMSEDRLITAITKLDEKIQQSKTAATDRDEGKEVSLGTSKINYIDPRITVAWCKKHDVPVTKVFSKTLLEKFKWTEKTEPDFVW